MYVAPDMAEEYSSMVCPLHIGVLLEAVGVGVVIATATTTLSFEETQPYLLAVT